jgi:hypothetical protein
MLEARRVRGIAVAFLCFACALVLTAIALRVLPSSILSQLIARLPGVSLRSPADVAVALSKSTSLLLKAAAGMLCWAWLGFAVGKWTQNPEADGDTNLAPASPPPVWYVALTGVMAFGIGIALTAYRLHESFWCDEAIRMTYALKGSWIAPWFAGYLDNTRPYLYLVRGLVSVFGFSEMVARAPSLLFYSGFAWFLAVICWNEQQRVLSGIGGALLLLFYLLAPEAQHSAGEASAHIMAASLVGVGLWSFTRIGQTPDRRRALLVSLACGACAMATVIFSLAFFVGIWLSIVVARLARRPIVGAEEARWLYVATTIAWAIVFIVYAPALPRTVVWVNTFNPYGGFGAWTFLPWTSGWMGALAVLLGAGCLIVTARKRMEYLAIPLTICAVWCLLHAQHIALGRYAASGGAAMMLLCCVCIQSVGRGAAHRAGAMVMCGLMVVAMGQSLRHWSRLHSLSIPRSFAREQVRDMRKSDRVLLVGHCRAPLFYIEKKGVRQIVKCNSRSDLDRRLATEPFDWVVLNGAAAGDPDTIVGGGVIPASEYTLVSTPRRSELIWVWRRLASPNVP